MINSNKHKNDMKIYEKVDGEYKQTHNIRKRKRVIYESSDSESDEKSVSSNTSDSIESTDSDEESVMDTQKEFAKAVANRKNIIELLNEYNEERIKEAEEIWKPYHYDENDKKQYNIQKRSAIGKSKLGFASEKEGWVSATSIKNFIFNDPLIDWLDSNYDDNVLELYDLFIDNNSRRVSKRRRLHDKEKMDEIKNKMKDMKNSNDNLSILFDNGNAFEDKVNNSLRMLANIKCREFPGTKFVTVFTQEDYARHRKRTDLKVMREKFNETKEYMNKGIPIISQAVLMNDNNYTYGVADLLIRSDYINEFFTLKLDDDNLLVGSPNLDFDEVAHYRVIDIKWTTLTFCVNGQNLRNEARIPSYKAQLTVYNVALGRIQGFTPNQAYLLSKAFFIDSKREPERGYSCYDRLGVVDYEGFDKQYIERTKEAIKWKHKVLFSGKSWGFSHDKPDIPELYPNMCNRNDTKWTQVKDAIAAKYDELTKIWYVGVPHRKRCHEKKIYRSTDEKCTSEALGVIGKRGEVINEILTTNRSSDLVHPLEISDAVFNQWFTPETTDYYIDFETINGALYQRPADIDIMDSKGDPDIIFMIGIGFKMENYIDSSIIMNNIGLPSDDIDTCGSYYNSNGEWEYVCLYMKDFCIEQEKSVIKKFMEFIEQRRLLINSINNTEYKESRLFHWTIAEPRVIASAKSRHYDTLSEDDEDKSVVKVYNKFNSTCKWIDMYDLFTKHPITIKGCFDFKLKSVTKALYKHNLIDTTWPDTGIADGFTAMMEASKLYKDIEDNSSDSSELTQQDIINNNNYKIIVDYNEIDCKALYSIRNFLTEKYKRDDEEI